MLLSVLSRNGWYPKFTAPGDRLDTLSPGLHNVLVEKVESVVVVVTALLIGEVYPQVQVVLIFDTRLPTGDLSSLSVGAYWTSSLRRFLKRIERVFLND